MPRTKSAKKALRQNVTRHSRNLARTKAFKTTLKSLRKLVSTGNTTEATALLPKLQKALDKAAKTNVIAKNKASRLASRAAHAIASSAKAKTASS